MTSSRRYPLGAIFVTLLIVMAAVVVADMLSIDAREERNYRHATTIEDDRVVAVTQLHATEGDVVWANAERIIPSPNPIGAYDFLIVEAGGGAAIQSGGEPTHILLHVTGMSGDVCCSRDAVRTTRPADVGADAERLDLVWIFQYKADIVRPLEAEARASFDNWTRLSLASGGTWTPVVLKAAAVRVHAFAVTVEVVAGVAAVIVGLAWARRTLSRGPQFEAGAERESLVHLVELGGEHLRRLRAMWLFLGVPLIYIVFVGMAPIMTRLGELSGPSAEWSAPLQAALTVVTVGLVLGWAVAAYGAHRAVRRWHANEAARPLDL